jgi:hypothetical protein
MYLITKKELELKKQTAINILENSNSYYNKSKIIKFLEKLELINNLRCTEVYESRQEKERKG